MFTSRSNAAGGPENKQKPLHRTPWRGLIPIDSQLAPYMAIIYTNA